MYSKILIMLAAAGLGVSVAAGTSAAASRSTAVGSATVGRSSSPTASLRLLTEPVAGIGPIYKLITGAKHSVDRPSPSTMPPRSS